MVAEMSPRVRLQSWRTAGCGPHCRRVRGTADGTRTALWFDLHDPADHEQAGRLDGVGAGYDRGFAAGRSEETKAARAEGWSAGAALAALVIAPQINPDATTVRTGALAIDLAAGTVAVEGRDVLLSEVEWLILSHLAARLGRLATKVELTHVLWPDGLGRRHFGDRPVSVPAHVIRVHMQRLRAKLGPAASLVKTVPERGYVLLREEPTS